MVGRTAWGRGGLGGGGGGGGGGGEEGLTYQNKEEVE